MRTPDLTGAGGRAWRLRLPPVGARGRVELDASVDGWIVDSPHSHPLWRWYGVGVVHLRPVTGPDGVERQAQITVPGATHEVLVGAHNPESPDPVIEEIEALRSGIDYMTPLDHVVQVALPGDAEAQALGEAIVRHAVEDGQSLDQDYRRYWRTLIETTAEHYRTGHVGA